jgi:hypothetical protein
MSDSDAATLKLLHESRVRAHEILLRKIHDMTFFEYMVRKDEKGKSEFQLQCDHLLQLSVSPSIVGDERAFKERDEKKKGSFPVDGRIKLQTISGQDLDLTKSREEKLNAIKLGEFNWEMGFPLRETKTGGADYEAVSAQEAEKRGLPYTAYCHYHPPSDTYVITFTDTPLDIFKTACRVNFHLQAQSRVIRQHYDGSANPCDDDFFLKSHFTSTTMVSGIYRELRARVDELKKCQHRGSAFVTIPEGTPMDTYAEADDGDDNESVPPNAADGEGACGGAVEGVGTSAAGGAVDGEGDKGGEADKEKEAVSVTLRPRQHQPR